MHFQSSFILMASRSHRRRSYKPLNPYTILLALCLLVDVIECSVGQGRDGCNLPLEAADTPRSTKFRRCNSMLSEMNQERGTKRINFYSPVHSPPPEPKYRPNLATQIAPTMSAPPAQLRQNLRTGQPGDDSAVYTQLQTQLFPQMQF